MRRLELCQRQPWSTPKVPCQQTQLGTTELRTHATGSVNEPELEQWAKEGYDGCLPKVMLVVHAKGLNLLCTDSRASAIRTDTMATYCLVWGLEEAGRAARSKGMKDTRPSVKWGRCFLINYLRVGWENKYPNLEWS